MSGALDRKVAIVTGASAGIGEATAVALAEAGASVALVARRTDRLTRLAEKISESGGTAMVCAADVAVVDEVRAVAQRALDAWGRIDILVNNAGIMQLSPITEGCVEDWSQMIDVNVKGVLHGVAAVMPVFLEQGSGHIVNVGSVAGRRPFPGATVYAATKFATRALSWGMHLELGAAHGIRVTDIQPGYVETELLDRVADEGARDAFKKAWEGKRPLQPEDIARSVLFAVTSPDHVSVSEVLVRPVDQAT